jgi:hypothetical protein
VRHIVHIVICVVFTLFAISAFSQTIDRRKPPKSRAPKKIIKYGEDQPVYPAIQIPDPIEAFRMTVIGEVEGFRFHEKDVPIFFFRPYQVSAGSVPIGSEFKAESVRTIAGRHFYGFQRQPTRRGELDQTVWIDGTFLQATRLTKQ